jgi:hypothetical protein
MADSDGNQNWMALYREAVLESDRRKIKTRVAEAQTVMCLRALEMWYAGPMETTERRQMDAASHFLRVLCQVGADK